VGDYSITGGLFYLGSAVPAAYAAMYEPALIDPRAPVRHVRLDDETPAESERPAYGDLTPGARAAYLEWLSGGRVDPTPPAHLWLFLYGLERRILVDLAGTLGSQEEYAAIAAAVAALRERYAHAVAFERQAADFADLLDSLIGLGDPALQPPPPGPRTGDLPMRLRVGIGRYVARRLPISSGWAYAWYAYSPQRNWGPAATQRPEEFRRAFAARYAEAYPSGGMAVTPPTEGLVLAYHPASPGFADRTVRIHTQLPDVRGLAAPLEALAAVAAKAEADLPGAARPPSGPAWPELRGSQAHSSPPPPGAAASAAPGAGPATEVPYAGATAAAGPSRVRPDRRPQVAAAEALMQLVTIAGLPDGHIRAMRRHVVGVLKLTAAERHGLDDELDAFAHRRPDWTVVRRRYANLTAEHQQIVGDLLIAAAGANGVVEPEQAGVLGAVFAVLGPGAAELRERLRDLEVAAVVEDSTMDVTVLDEELVERTLDGAVAAAALVDALVAPELSRASR
jgi:hypothetical protein